MAVSFSSCRPPILGHPLNNHLCRFWREDTKTYLRKQRRSLRILNYFSDILRCDPLESSLEQLIFNMAADEGGACGKEKWWFSGDLGDWDNPHCLGLFWQASGRRITAAPPQLKELTFFLTFFLLFDTPSSNSTYVENEILQAKRKMFVIIDPALANSSYKMQRLISRSIISLVIV